MGRDRAMRRQLLELVDKWEELSEGVSTGSDWGPTVLWECAQEVRAILQHRGDNK